MADIGRLLGDGRVVGIKNEGQSALWSNFELLFLKKVENTLDMFFVPLAKIR